MTKSKSVYMHISLKGKITLVTGVSCGIGREIAQLLAERGARVFGTVRNPQSITMSNSLHLC
jgi:NAD(P)-dependent dehydrogenase (short-subunit alcohol dehydrogenase family)